VRITRPSFLPMLALSMVALIGSVAPAGAYQTVRSEGTIGSFSYTDAVGASGARCDYQLDVPGAQGNDLDRITVYHPVVFSSAGTRKVGWRFIVQRSVQEGGTGGWKTLFKSGFQRRSATTTAPAAFTDRGYLVQADKDYHFRTLVVIQWYEKGSSTAVDGFVRLRTEYYRSVAGGSNRQDMLRCLPEY
jgi:hypothetical protein